MRNWSEERVLEIPSNFFHGQLNGDLSLGDDCYSISFLFNITKNGQITYKVLC
jgi:hypothetical protein